MLMRVSDSRGQINRYTMLIKDMSRMMDNTTFIIIVTKRKIIIIIII